MFWNKPFSWVQRGAFGLVLCLCLFCTYGCSIRQFDLSGKSLPSFDLDIPLLGEFDRHLSEVSPPTLIESLKAKAPWKAPEVHIVQPESGETVNTEEVEIKLAVSGLTVFKDSQLGLGPHILVVVDDRDPIEVFDLNAPIRLKDLKPGTHLIRAIAEYPWHESFKNPSAYAQSSFKVLTSSQLADQLNQPILTTSSLQATYTQEPILLDFVVRQANNHSEQPPQAASNVHLKATLNDEAFTIPESEAHFYIEGLKSGDNWLKLGLETPEGKPLNAPFNEQLFRFKYQPERSDPLGDLTAGTLKMSEAEVLIGQTRPTPPKSPEPPKVETSTSPKALSPKVTPPPATIPSIGKSNPPTSSTTPKTPSKSGSDAISPQPLSETKTLSRTSESINESNPVKKSVQTKVSSGTSSLKPNLPSKATGLPEKSIAPSPTENKTGKAIAPKPTPSMSQSSSEISKEISKEEKPKAEGSRPISENIENLDKKFQSVREESQEHLNQSLKNWRDRFRSIRQDAKTKTESKLTPNTHQSIQSPAATPTDESPTSSFSPSSHSDSNAIAPNSTSSHSSTVGKALAP